MKKVKVIYSFRSPYGDIATGIDPYREYCFYVSILGVRKYLPGAEIILIADKETVNFLQKSNTADLLDIIHVVDWKNDYNLGADEYMWYSPKWLGLSILPVTEDDSVLFLDLDAIPLSPMEEHLAKGEYFSQDCRPEDGGLKNYSKVFKDYSPWNGLKPERQGCGGFIYFPKATVAKVVSLAMLQIQRCICRKGQDEIHKLLCSVPDEIPSYAAGILLGEEHIYPAITEAVTGQVFTNYKGLTEHLGLHCKYAEHREGIKKSVKRLLEHFPESRKYYGKRLQRFCEGEKRVELV